MKKPTWVLSTMLLGAMSLPAQSFGLARLVQSAQPVASSNHYYVETAAKKTPVRRSKKKSAAIVGGSALGGA
ncbi:MAG TPA: hypothetical protein VJ453_03990, partial [Terriglobales bacterium]|nr:hypothetical protein [Terriglobales bacterium]